MEFNINLNADNCDSYSKYVVTLPLSNNTGNTTLVTDDIDLIYIYTMVDNVTWIGNSWQTDFGGWANLSYGTNSGTWSGTNISLNIADMKVQNVTISGSTRVQTKLRLKTKNKLVSGNTTYTITLNRAIAWQSHTGDKKYYSTGWVYKNARAILSAGNSYTYDYKSYYSTGTEYRVLDSGQSTENLGGVQIYAKAGSGTAKEVRCFAGQTFKMNYSYSQWRSGCPGSGYRYNSATYANIYINGSVSDYSYDSNTSTGSYPSYPSYTFKVYAQSSNGTSTYPAIIYTRQV